MASAIGYNGKIEIEGQELCVTKWSVNEKVDEIDVTTTCDNGFVKYIPGAADADITLEGILGTDNSEDPMDRLALRDLADIHIGSVAAITIFPDDVLAAGSSWVFPQALITGLNMEGAPRDTVKWTIMAKGKKGGSGALGVWTEPDMV
jgi:hypothetical protein